MKSKRDRVAIWAIDPFEKETYPDPAVVDRLLKWARNSSHEIQPVYVLTIQKEVNRLMIGDKVAAAQKAAEQYLRDNGMSDVLPAKILVLDSGSRARETETLLRFADSHEAACVIVSSHGRHGLPRLVMGSFAENLLARARQPIFFLDHQNVTVGSNAEIKRALFTTDFSPHSLKAFLRFLPEARRSRLEITLFYCVCLPSSALVSSYGAPISIPEDYFPDQIRWAKHEAERWSGIARRQDVPIRAIVKDLGISSEIVPAILAAASEAKADLIAMASTSGNVSALVAGSVAREVFRAGRFPVWVYGPKALEKEHEKGTRAQSVPLPFPA